MKENGRRAKRKSARGGKKEQGIPSRRPPFLGKRVVPYIMVVAMDSSRIREMIEKGLSASFVEVDGDGTHFGAVVVSEEFRGKSPVERHKLVYGTLGDAMGGEIHALSIKAYTAEQWEKRND